jgi:hypothetical protein
MALKSYVEFLIETYTWANTQQVKREFFQAVGKSVLEHEEYKAFHHLLQESHELVDVLYESALNEEWGVLNEESYLEKFQKKFSAAKEYVKEKGKKALDNLSKGTQVVLKFGGDILKPLNMVIEKIGSLAKKLWDEGMSLAKKAVEASKPEIIKRVTNVISSEDKKTSLREELKSLDAMAGVAAKWVTGGFVEDLKKASNKAATTDTEQKSEGVSYTQELQCALILEITKIINQEQDIRILMEEMELFLAEEVNDLSMLMEGGAESEGKRKLSIPFLSGLMTKIGHMPPFSWFHKLGEKAEQFANNTLGRVSYMLSKIADAPGPFEFHVLGQIFGVAVSYYTEDAAKGVLKVAIKALEKALHIAIPGVGILLKIIQYGGLALAIYGTIEALVGDSKEKKEEGEKKEGDEKKGEEKK